MSRPVVIQASERSSGRIDFLLSAGREGRERVRVVHTLHRTFACMTCHQIDCEHARGAARHYAEHGTAVPQAEVAHA